MIIIKPVGGLCNRLRVIDSAIALAVNYKIKLHIIWELNQACNCKFSDLFIVPGEIDRLTEIENKFVITFLNIFLPRYYYYFNNKKIANLKNQEDGIETLLTHKTVYIKTCERFYNGSAFFNLIPREAIQNIIGSYKKENMIGIHVRRTDNTHSIINSPIEKFIEYMKNEIASDNDVYFFLSTDDPSVEILFQKELPNRIVTHAKESLDRNNPLAIQDAVIDLYSLANCSKIIGSYWSSFSDIASELKGIEKVIIKD